MNQHKDIANDINIRHQFAVQLDKRNGTDFKCYDEASLAFRSYLRHATGHSEPDRNSLADIVALCSDICGVNFSIGYRNEHTDDEYLVTDGWNNTLELYRQWLANGSLPQFLQT